MIRKALSTGLIILLIATVCLLVFHYQAKPNKIAYIFSFGLALVCVVFLYSRKQFRENLKTRKIISSSVFMFVLLPIHFIVVGLLLAFFIAFWTTFLAGENVRLLAEVVKIRTCGKVSNQYTCIDLNSTEGNFSAVRLEERYKSHVMINTKVGLNVDRSPLGYKVNSAIPLFDLKPN